jgi:hypothetical protein
MQEGGGMWRIWMKKEGSCRVERDVVTLDKSHPTFRSKLLHSSSRLKMPLRHNENINDYAILLTLTAE